MPKKTRTNSKKVSVDDITHQFKNMSRIEPKITYYGYIRVSSNAQTSTYKDPHHFSLDYQMMKIMEYAITNKIDIEDVITEVASARSMVSQPSLRKLMRENNNITIIVLNITRFSRNLLDSLNWIENDFKKRNISIISVADHINTQSAQGRHQLRVMLSDAQKESDVISERVRASVEYRRSQGIPIGKMPYGFQTKVGDKQRTKEKKTSEYAIITLIVALRTGLLSSTDINTLLGEITPIASDEDKIKYFDCLNNVIEFIKPNALTYSEIADILNEYGILKKGKEWTTTTVSALCNSKKHEAMHVEIVAELKKRFVTTNPQYNSMLAIEDTINADDERERIVI